MRIVSWLIFAIMGALLLCWFWPAPKCDTELKRLPFPCGDDECPFCSPVLVAVDPILDEEEEQELGRS